MILRLPAPFGCLLACALLASADEITLKDGRVVEGEITQEDEKVVKLKLKKGAMTLDRKDIVGIVRKPTADQEYAQRKAKLPPKDAKASLELATWCASRKLEAEAIAHFIEAHGLDATLSAAAEELVKRDYHLVEGVWQNPDTYYAGLGWLKLNSTWYHPLEHAWRVCEAEAGKAKDKLDGNRAEAKTAQAAASRTTAQVDAERKKIDATSIELAAGRTKLAELQTAHSNATVKRAAAEESVKAGEVEFEASREGEGGSLGGLQKMRQLRRDLSAAKIAEANAERAVAAQEKKNASSEAQIAASTARLADLTAAAGVASGKVTELDGLVPALEAELAAAKARAAEARAAWDKRPK